ncbi:hypothetical protein E1292_28590 [Nonomuraea deserti]|uniref:Uncharacterized protein n=1 Tax=Nonomuraea deserti TaxID=1848322 RepID=A0A4R4V5P3_9ACTN|nr:hypothetical protein [Nonomuraea deserti]TDD00519.1 hypothetical protein E1292_28590 [Nonomuraea deserti]
MGDVTRTLSISWWGKTWYVAAYAALIAVTGSAAVLLVALNIDVGRSMWPDAQPDDQVVAKWRTAAVLAYTSGSAVGHVCALLAGLLAARWARNKTWRTGFVTAVLAGAGLGLADLAVASWRAAPLLRVFAASPVLTDNDGTLIVDPGLRHHGCIPAAMAVVFATLLIVAGLGFGVAQARPANKCLLIVVSLALVPIAHFWLPAVVMLSGVGPY